MQGMHIQAADTSLTLTPARGSASGSIRSMFMDRIRIEPHLLGSCRSRNHAADDLPRICVCRGSGVHVLTLVLILEYCGVASSNPRRVCALGLRFFGWRWIHTFSFAYPSFSSCWKPFSSASASRVLGAPCVLFYMLRFRNGCRPTRRFSFLAYSHITDAWLVMSLQCRDLASNLILIWYVVVCFAMTDSCVRKLEGYTNTKTAQKYIFSFILYSFPDCAWGPLAPSMGCPGEGRLGGCLFF